VNDPARFEVVEPGDVIRARLRGELDMSNANEVGTSIAAAVPNDAEGLILDLTELEFIDSAGIRTLLSLVGRFGWHGQKLTFVAAPGSPVRRVIELAGAGDAFALEGSGDGSPAEPDAPG
jgi:anti-anti-sigma factor